jgi:hypothetical protein
VVNWLLKTINVYDYVKPGFRTELFLKIGLVMLGAGISFKVIMTAAAGERAPYFGDLHIHTRLSTDAYTFGTRATPDDAYRFAKGESITHPAGYEIALKAPLDFSAVTDHGEYLGMLSAMGDPESPLSKLPEAARLANPKTLADRNYVFRNAGPILGQHFDEATVRSAWQVVVAAAERHYVPGRFTTFSGYEYTAAPGGQNLHRNVIFRGTAVPELIFTRLDSMNPESLWAWMDALREKGIESLAIPHNSNGSNGQMFELEKFEGGPLDAAYAEQRLRNEPLVEATQVKGTSDTHPFLSPNDEWADFEILPYRIAQWVKARRAAATCAGVSQRHRVAAESASIRTALGSSARATRMCRSSFDETNHFSKVGVLDGTPERRLAVPSRRPSSSGILETYFRYWSARPVSPACGRRRTRESIYDAFRRRGRSRRADRGFPCASSRAFPSRRSPPPGRSRRGGARAGAAMGSRLAQHKGRTSALRVGHARSGQRAVAAVAVIRAGSKSTPGARLRRGLLRWLTPDAATRRCPDNGAKVDTTTCATTANVGAGEMATV